jgi:hypothetical protein
MSLMDHIILRALVKIDLICIIVPLMHEKLQGLKERGELIKKENEGKKKLEVAYINNDNFFCEQVKVKVFSNTGERATPYIRQATKQYWDYAIFAMVLW